MMTNRAHKSRRTRVERRFQQLADELLEKANRIRCTLDERQRGLLLVQESIDTMLTILQHERLRS
jgi:septation ring formation regulator EzrA